MLPSPSHFSFFSDVWRDRKREKEKQTEKDRGSNMSSEWKGQSWKGERVDYHFWYSNNTLEETSKAWSYKQRNLTCFLHNFTHSITARKQGRLGFFTFCVWYIYEKEKSLILDDHLRFCFCDSLQIYLQQADLQLLWRCFLLGQWDFSKPQE